MKFSLGNAKLGDNVVAVSRPVGDTCPQNCEFLNNGCYAENTEKMYPNVRQSYKQNLITESGKIRSMLLMAFKQNRAVRIHVHGDWLLDNKLDLEYVNNWVKAIESIPAKSRPPIWFYTHVLDKRLLAFDKLGVKVYASVSKRKKFLKAKKLGFKLFAWGDQEAKIAKRKKGPHSELPSYMEIEGERFLVCPEMRLGRAKVTCTGTCDTIKCGMCFGDAARNVLFLKH